MGAPWEETSRYQEQLVHLRNRMRPVWRSWHQGGGMNLKSLAGPVVSPRKELGF